MVVGAALFAVDAFMMPSSLADIEALHSGHGDDHGATNHEEKATTNVADAHSEASAHGDDSHSGGHEMTEEEHNQHLLDGYKNKPWSAVYIAAFFFFMIALGCLAFYAVQYASQAGWSPLLLRVMEAITAYLLPGSIIMFVSVSYTHLTLPTIYSV